MSKIGKSIAPVQRDQLEVQLRQVTAGRLQEEKSIAQGIIYNAAHANITIDEAFIRKAYEAGRLYREVGEERGGYLFELAIEEAKAAEIRKNTPGN